MFWRVPGKIRLVSTSYKLKNVRGWTLCAGRVLWCGEAVWGHCSSEAPETLNA